MNLPSPFPILASWEAPVFLVSIVAVVGGVIFLSMWLHRKRQAALAEIARSLGLRFIEKPDEAWLDKFQRFPLSSRGRANRIAGGVVEGSLGTDGGVVVRVFDHSYTAGSGKSSHTYFATVVALELVSATLPVFVLREEGAHFSFFGLFKRPEDINFDGWPLFSDKFHLTGEDESEVRRLFSPQVLDFFEQRIGQRVECAGDSLIYYRSGKKLKPAQIPGAIREVGELAALLLASGS